jgi:hypothetical protein
MGDFSSRVWIFFAVFPSTFFYIARRLGLAFDRCRNSNASLFALVFMFSPLTTPTPTHVSATESATESAAETLSD